MRIEAACVLGTDEFLSTYVGPGIYKLMGRQLGKTFATALLWAATTTENMHLKFTLMPSWLKDRFGSKNPRGY